MDCTARFDSIDAQLAELRAGQVRAAEAASAGSIDPADYPLAGGFSLPNEAGYVKWLHGEQRALELGPTRTVTVPQIDGPPHVYIVKRPVGHCWRLRHPEVSAAIADDKVRAHVEWVGDNAAWLGPYNADFDYDRKTPLPGFWSFSLVDPRGEKTVEQIAAHMAALYDYRDENQAAGNSTTWDAFGKASVPFPA